MACGKTESAEKDCEETMEKWKIKSGKKAQKQKNLKQQIGIIAIVLPSLLRKRNT